MTNKQKRQFIRELTRAVTRDALAKVPDMPEEWDGVELRRYLADKFEDATIILARGRVRDTGNTRRLRDYRNAVLERNL